MSSGSRIGPTRRAEQIGLRSIVQGWSATKTPSAGHAGQGAPNMQGTVTSIPKGHCRTTSRSAPTTPVSASEPPSLGPQPLQTTAVKARSVVRGGSAFAAAASWIIGCPESAASTG